MAGEQIPETWIGQEVIVLVGRNKETFDGPLVDVNDRGVTIRYFQNFEELADAREKGEEEGERVYVLYFFPWRVVWSIARREDEA